ncbi:hypothetical protein CAPTEDRAFT_191891 [Capitella teleta]|uniref:Uncharacterized protein n=1 Tax=Capitella teleta TaxID=283909 RepID=R7VM23_CAPTE|nr:hypothetical protein CAPTEDRAFT_191891 [Capitella teleta]|eukprot:ELU18120.1 hypothetical protein CAPTEDRAFT_191891 [Capitella teleta]
MGTRGSSRRGLVVLAFDATRKCSRSPLRCQRQRPRLPPIKTQRASTRSSRANAAINVTAATSDATDAPTPSTSAAEFDRIMDAVTDKLFDRLSQRMVSWPQPRSLLPLPVLHAQGARMLLSTYLATNPITMSPMQYAVLGPRCERVPNNAPGRLKHLESIQEMHKKFGPEAWCFYDRTVGQWNMTRRAYVDNWM